MVCEAVGGGDDIYDSMNDEGAGHVGSDLAIGLNIRLRYLLLIGCEKMLTSSGTVV